MKRALIGLGLACAACTQLNPSVITPAVARDGSAFRVAILGDMPYPGPSDARLSTALAAYKAVLDTIAAERVAFVVHIGDITGFVCSDSVYAQRQREFAAMPHPMFYTFGDNEWTDCARNNHDPIERLTTLRRMFTQGDVSLGQNPLPVERQSADSRYAIYRENVRWRMGGVLFVTLHVVGSNNNWGWDSTPSAEYVARNAANLAWLRDAFAVAEREGVRGVGIFLQANPNWPRPTRATSPPPDGFAELTRELQRLAESYGKPVAVVHGDTHYFRVDKPLTYPQSPAVLTNVTRAETFGDPNHHALMMMVDPGSPNVFSFEPLIVRHNIQR